MREDGIAGAQPSPGWRPPDDFPVTPEQVYAYREARGIPRSYTMFAPMTVGEPLVCFASRGHYEWFLHPADAELWLRDGVVVAGKRLRCQLSPTPWYPYIGGVQVMAHDTETNLEFIPSGVGAAA